MEIIMSILIHCMYKVKFAPYFSGLNIVRNSYSYDKRPSSKPKNWHWNKNKKKRDDLTNSDSRYSVQCLSCLRSLWLCEKADLTCSKGCWNPNRRLPQFIFYACNTFAFLQVLMLSFVFCFSFAGIVKKKFENSTKSSIRKDLGVFLKKTRQNKENNKLKLTVKENIQK